MKSISCVGACLAVGLLSFASGSPGYAQTKIKLAHTLSDAYLAAMVAKDKGFFEKRGLDVDLQAIALTSTIPAALHSGSTELAGLTTSVFLQAVDSGIDFVAVAGGNLIDKTYTRYAALARAGLDIGKPEDFIGKKVGAPGLGSTLHVLFCNWLLAKGIDWKKVNFVEVAFPQMNDVLKSGNVDAVIVLDPMLYRIVKAGTGKVVSQFAEVLPSAVPGIIYAATRKWANEHSREVKAFRDSIAEAVAAIEADPGVGRAAIAQHIKLPPDVIEGMPIAPYRAQITDESLQNWVDIMQRQGLLANKIDVSRLVVR